MKTKAAVISLILLFFISTVGLPISINLCSMLDEPAEESSFMHSKDITCENTNLLIPITKFSKDDCCKTEIIDKSISDKYLQVDAKGCSPNQNIISVINSYLLDNYFFENPVKYSNNISPPALSNHIYLNNSILLI